VWKDAERKLTVVQLQTTQLNLPPGMIHLGIGQPSPSLLPLDIMLKASEHRLQQADPTLLAYGAEQGDVHFRTTLARFLSDKYHEDVDPHHLFITASASQGLDLIATMFTQAGDTIFVEEPSYFLALRIFADHQLNVVGIPTDADGVDVRALEAELASHQPVFLYTIPTHHNPASVTLSSSRREQLLRLSRKHDFIIVADEVYHLLSYSESPPRPLACRGDQGNVLSLGSFSKILAPGLRLGWIQGSPELLEKVIWCGLVDSGGGLNPFTSGIVKSVIEMGLLNEHLSHLQSVYAHRMGVLQSAIGEEFPASITFSKPKGGFFIWLRLPDAVDAEVILTEAWKQNVAFTLGSRFSSCGALKNYMRLSFALFADEDLKTGAQRLGRVLKQHLLRV
jgi:2-aminoadipate transaminase